MASSSSSSSSSNSVSRWKYDVFLSFRGEDTRLNFTDHLYNALVRAGIHTFRDDDELQRGEEIGPELLKAIEESRFSLIVLSKNYASSTWCLDELVHALACRKTLGHAVFPVFYNVDPSVVRHQRRSFAKAFAKHEERFKYDMDKDKVKRWKDALREVANLKGLDLPKEADGHESKNIDNIVKEISDRLNRPKLRDAIYPVGLHSRAVKVISLLSNESCEAYIVGIHGMGGIGKTTIAKEVYNLIFHNFEGSCFLADVRQNSNPKGILQLQRQLLSETLMRKHEKIYNDDRGLNVIQERLCHKRVLVVLDDVDEVDQVNKILGNHCWLWLCPGSRIVITTRIKDLLKPPRLYRQYKVEELDDKESLQLLSLHAFDMCHPINKYLECAESVVRYAGGNPLALKVLGSSLSDQGVGTWNSTLEKLKVIGNKQINMVLEISYDSLDDTEKFLFLDIACFFIGKDKNYVMSILEGCGFFPTAGINNLIKRCLISINFDNKLMMHDLLRDMGRDIVRQECPQEPGNRSRLWRHEDAIDVLTDKTGTKAVEGLILNLPTQSQKFSTKAFKKMIRLRLLQLNYVCLTGSFEKFSRKLRWLCWHEFPLGSIPDDLHLGNLVALDMRYSKLEQLPEEFQAQKLKFLNLSHSHVLTKILNFEGFPNLEILKLKDCVSLDELHESIGILTQLLFLNFQDCKNLTNLPESIGTLRSVIKLNISGCSKLEDLPEDFGNMKSLVKLVADRTSISKLPATFGNLNNLRNLSFSDCPLMLSLRKGPSITSVLPLFLEKLDLRHCDLTDDLFPRDLHGLSRLKKLKLCGNNFSRLPADIGSLTNLHTLWLNKCRSLESVPNLSSSLRSLLAQDCPLLESIDLTHIRQDLDFDLVGCPKLKVVEGFFNLEPVEVETVEKLLGTRGLLTPESIASVQVHMVNSFTSTATIGPLQALSERGIYSIFLPFKEIPSWFNYQNEGYKISLHVPPPEQGHKIMGFIICAVYAWEKCHEPCYFSPQIKVSNRTKMFDWIFDPKVAFFQREVQDDFMWLSYWMFDKQHPFIDEPDMSWRFEEEMQAGDHIDVSIDIGFGILVKKCGIHLLYWQSSQSDELAMISRASSRHYRRFTQTYVKWIEFNRQRQRVKASSGRNQDQEKDFLRWAQGRKEKVDEAVAAPSTSNDLRVSIRRPTSKPLELIRRDMLTG